MRVNESINDINFYDIYERFKNKLNIKYEASYALKFNGDLNI
jgi:hypothetical protein